MRIWLLTSAFCKAQLLADCLEHIYSSHLMKPGNLRHVIIDNHYPIDKERNRAAIVELADHYGCDYFDSGKDLGLHHGLNAALKFYGVLPTDLVITCDPDDRPAPGFINAMAEVMLHDGRIAVLGCNFWVIEQRFKEGKLTESRVSLPGFHDSHRVWTHQSIEMWNVAAYNYAFIQSIGGFTQPNAYYGGLEAALYSHPNWNKQGMKLAYLPDYSSADIIVDRGNKFLFDPEYRKWKDDHLAGFAGSFEEWLKLKAPHLL